MSPGRGGSRMERWENGNMCFRFCIPLLAALIAASAVAASAGEIRPSVIAGAGSVALWDDETYLGAGPVVAGGISVPLARHVSLEGEIQRGTHHRDRGALAADGTAVIGIARVGYLFRSPDATFRPFASAGYGFIRSTGTLTTTMLVAGDRGAPVVGGVERRDWSVTGSGFELGGGASFAIAPRISLRPEFRWSSLGQPSRSSIEPPLWVRRISASVLWRL